MSQKIAFASVLTLLTVLSGCQSLTPQQRQWLEEGEAAYQAQRYPAAIEQLSLFIRNVTDQPEAARAYYVRALAKLRLGQRLAAREDLRRSIAVAEDKDLRWRSLSVLASIDYEDHQWAAAAQSYAAAAQLAPEEPPLDIILFRLGVSLERANRWAESRAPFARLAQLFPKSSVTGAAQRRLQIEPDYFAVQVGAFSSESNALRLVEQLRAENYPAYARAETRNGARLNVVLIGRFDKFEDAERALAEVRETQPNAILWP